MLVVGAPRIASADDDPWFGPDKAKHFGVSAVLAAGGYSIGVVAFDDRLPSLLLGGGIALTAGVGKEVYDSMGYGHASARDLVWDVIGTGAGLAVAWVVDYAVRGNRAAGDPKVQATGTSLRIRF